MEYEIIDYYGKNKSIYSVSMSINIDFENDTHNT